MQDDLGTLGAVRVVIAPRCAFLLTPPQQLQPRHFIHLCTAISHIRAPPTTRLTVPAWDGNTLNAPTPHCCSRRKQAGLPPLFRRYG